MQYTVDGHDPETWIRNLEKSNIVDGEGLYDIWQEINLKVKTRGSGMPGTYEWPGYVYIPSYVLEPMLLNRELRVPSEWDALNVEVLSRIVGTLLAWNVDRKILRLTDVAAEVARNSWVDVPLKTNPFAMLPGMAVYIELTNVISKTSSSPKGVFVSLNVRQNGMPELVFAVDFSTALDIRAFPLNGKRPDEIFDEIQKNWVASFAKNDSCEEVLRIIPNSVLEYGGDLQILLSATLMSCISRPKRVRDLNIDSGAGHSRGRVSVWGVGEDVQVDIDSMSAALGVSHLESKGVVAQWTANDDGTIVELKCTSITRNTTDFLSGLAKNT